MEGGLPVWRQPPMGVQCVDAAGASGHPKPSAPVIIKQARGEDLVFLIKQKRSDPRRHQQHHQHHQRHHLLLPFSYFPSKNLSPSHESLHLLFLVIPSHPSGM